MIRKALEKDIKRINELGLSYNPSFSKTYNLKDYLNNDNYIILVDENVNSFLIIYKNIDCFELEYIVVDQNNRKKGLASNLLNYFLKKYGTIKTASFLEVSVLNEIAISFYKKYGFEIVGKREKYYNGIDAYIMKKAI